MPHKIEKIFIKSAGKKVFVQFEYPNGKLPRPAVVVAHGLRSYYTGFLNMFGKAFREAGYIVVKFHFLGTGKSEGKFEQKTTAAMLQNYKDVIAFVKSKKDVKGIGVMARSNGGDLAIIAGPLSEIKAYAFLAPAVFYSANMGKFTKNAEVKDGFFYHKSFKRKHTNGEGRLPLTFVEELKKFDKIILENIPKMKNVAFFQSEQDEAVPVAEGHFDYFKKHLPEPREIHYYKGGNHSFKGFKRVVVADALRWFNKKLPVNKV